MSNFKKIVTYIFLFSIPFNLFAQLGLIARYPFNGNANDAYGNNNGTVFGASLTSDRFGNENSAFNFNGYNNYISLPATNFNLPNFSYCAWVNSTNSTSFAQTIISIGYIGADQVLALSNNPQTNNIQSWNFFSYIYQAALPIPQIVVPAIIPLNNWHFVVATRSIAELKLYIDGKLIGTQLSGGVAPLYAQPIAATIGARSRNDIQFFQGKIDDVAIFDRALSADEISNMYNNKYSDTNNASLILQVNNPTNDITFNVDVNPSETKELVTIKGMGNVGINNTIPRSTMDINGSFATKIKKINQSQNTTLDGSATVWIFNNIGNITLPDATICENRRYYILNRRPEAKIITNSYIDFNGGNNSYILAASSIEIISDGQNWLQIK